MTPKDYQLIAKEAYQVQKNNKEGYAWREGNIIPINGTNWQVLKVKDNPWSGFQAMAIAPVSDGNSPNNVVIAYAGTDPFQFGDLYADFENVMLSNGGGANDRSQAVCGSSGSQVFGRIDLGHWSFSWGISCLGTRSRASLANRNF